MRSDIIIYGTDGCPFCEKAREEYGERATYYNVQKDHSKLEEMLAHSKGQRNVPVIVEGEQVTIGFGGS